MELTMACEIWRSSNADGSDPLSSVTTTPVACFYQEEASKLFVGSETDIQENDEIRYIALNGERVCDCFLHVLLLADCDGQKAACVA